MPAGDKADMFWRRVNATDSQLVSRNGAKFAAMGVLDYGSVTQAQVETLALSSAAIAHTALPAGTGVAFKTDAGRFGKSVIRKTGSDGKLIDSNNSTNDFESNTKASLIK